MLKNYAWWLIHGLYDRYCKLQRFFHLQVCINVMYILYWSSINIPFRKTKFTHALVSWVNLNWAHFLASSLYQFRYYVAPQIFRHENKVDSRFGLISKLKLKTSFSIFKFVSMHTLCYSINTTETKHTHALVSCGFASSTKDCAEQ